VKRGDLLALIHAQSQGDAEAASRALEEAIVLGEHASPRPLISERVTSAGVERLG
jgi:thymidine phosphorylase